MTREEKLEAIYKEMANKELTFGCKVKINKWIYEIINRKNGWFLSSYKGKYWDIHNTIVIEDGVNSRCYSIQKIIWHPVMIGDVLNWIDNKKFNVDDPMIWLFYDPKKMDYETKLFLVQDYLFWRVNGYWRKKRKPIEEQSEECIDYVYSLIQKY